MYASWTSVSVTESVSDIMMPWACAGGSWTHLKKKAGVPSEHDDSTNQSLAELEKDAQACRLLIRRLRVGQASEEAVKDLTSLKVSRGCRVESRHACFPFTLHALQF
jgi:hypothetical protein